MTRRLAVALTVLVLAVGLAGCGGGDRPVTGSASAALRADVSRLQLAATKGSARDVATAADRLRDDVRAQQAAGGLSGERAAAVLDQLARVLADVAARPAPAPTRSPSSAPSRAPAHHKGKKGHEEKGGHD